MKVLAIGAVALLFIVPSQAAQVWYAPPLQRQPVNNYYYYPPCYERSGLGDVLLGAVIGSVVTSAAQSSSYSSAEIAELRRQNQLLREQIEQQRRLAIEAAKTPEQRKADAEREYEIQLAKLVYAEELQSKNFEPGLSTYERNKKIRALGYEPGLLLLPLTDTGFHSEPQAHAEMVQKLRQGYCEFLLLKKMEPGLSKQSREKRIRALGYDPVTLKPLEDTTSSSLASK